MDNVPFVTIAIPCLNEERYIEAFLDDVFAQDYPKGRIEVLVGDGMSADRTRELIARKVASSGRDVRIIDNPRRIQAAAMNHMIAAARGDVIVRLDVHARYAKDYVRQCVTVLQETGAENAGGSQRAVAETWFQKALCAALDSKLAVGNAQYRNASAEGWVDTVFLGAFRREVFAKVGGYDPHAITNEDAELNQRVRESGGRVYLSPKIVVHYFPRDSYRSLAKQYFKYGQGRARTLLKHKRLPTVRPLLPFFLVLSGATLLATSPIQPFTLPALGLYGTASSLEALRVSFKRGWRALPLAPVVATIFPVLHVSHGVGFGAGLVKYLLSPDWEEHTADPLASQRELGT